jgi:hypothetical protein
MPVRIKTGNPCLFDGCSGVGGKRGYCSGHYRQLHKGKKLKPLLWTKKLSLERKHQPCHFAGCENECSIISWGLCRGHYKQKIAGKQLTALAGSENFKFKTTPYKRAERRIKNAQYRYGVSPEQYELLLKIQGGRCFICKTIPKRTLCIDHCHKSKKVRGLLCDKCNRGLGYFNDSLDLITAAADYLKSHL